MSYRNDLGKRGVYHEIRLKRLLKIEYFPFGKGDINQFGICKLSKDKEKFIL